VDTLLFEKEKGSVDKYPILATTYRLVEHMHTDAITRNLPGLAELMPEMLVEVSYELAGERNIRNGDRVRICSEQGEISAVVCVTRRLKPFNNNGTPVHQVALPWNFGYSNLAKGDSANSLSPKVADPNTMIPEFRAFLCNLERIS